MRASLPTVGALGLMVLLGSATVFAAREPTTAEAQPRAPSSRGESPALDGAVAGGFDGAARVRAENPIGPPQIVPRRRGSRTPQIPFERYGVPHEFYFARVAYSGFGGFYGGGGSWATDYPRADQIFLSFIDRLLPNIDAYVTQFIVTLDDPELRRFPFLYALEVGRMSLRPQEIEGLRNYLLQGGFLVIDDFWGTQEWAQFEYEIRRVLPEFEIVELPLDHEIFTTFYEIDEIIQVPNVGNGTRGGPTYERDGFIPHVRGIHDDNGRLMVVINWNTDLGDAWEWADDPYYPFEYSKYAYEMGVNFIVYAMSH